jgi:hypothetical protein
MDLEFVDGVTSEQLRDRPRYEDGSAQRDDESSGADRLANDGSDGKRPCACEVRRKR